MTGLIGLEYNGNTYYYVKNIQDDIIGILNSNYERVVTYEYDSWGKIQSIKDSQENEITDENNIGLINPFRYRSYYYDSETELYYLNSRYYSPKWKRFINADTIIENSSDTVSGNLYTYVLNNPIYSRDANGNFAISAGLAAGITLGVATTMALAGLGMKDAIISGIGTLITNISEQWNRLKREIDRVYAEAMVILQKFEELIESTTPKIVYQSNSISKTSKGEHNVYVLRDELTRQVKYVGRTKNIDSAKYRHHKNPSRNKLDFDAVAIDISKETARGLEQALIEKCNTLERNKENPIKNQINGLRANHPKYSIYWAEATTWLSENLVSCR